jgi:hypothetical protein
MSVQNEGVQYTLSLKDLFSNKIKTATTQTEKLNSVVGKTQNLFRSMGSALGVGVGIASVVGFGRAVIESLKNYEYFSASLRVLLKGDALAAKALESQLVALAKETPFNLTELQDATKQLLAYGFAAGDAVKNIKMLGDVASALKIPFQDIAYLYGTLKTQGRAFSKDIYQFTGRGIPIVKELAKQFKIADDEVMKFVEDGKVGFNDVEKAFQSMTTEGGMFFNMMDIQSQTVGGRLSMISDSWEHLKVNIGKSQTGIIASTVLWADTMLSKITSVIGRMNQMDENFKKFGAKEISGKTLDTVFPFFGAIERLNQAKEAEQFNDAIYSLYVDKPIESLKDGYKRKQELFNLLANQNKAYLKGELDLITKNRNAATLKGAIESVSGQIGLFGQKDPMAKPPKVPPDGTPTGGTPTASVEAQKMQNFNIDIGNLIEKFTIQTTNMKESSAAIKDEVTKALISAVNDFQLMATK